MNSSKPMTVAIDGATGFIGTHTANALAQHGHKVVAIVRENEKPQDLDVLKTVGSETVVWKRNDSNSLVAAMADCQCLVHLIGSIAPRKGENFSELHQGLAEQFYVAAKTAGLTKAVMISALGADRHASSMYHRTKWESEQRLRESGLDWVILRSSLVVGRSVGHRDSKLVRRYLNLIATKKRVPLVLGGANVVQPIHVDDVAQATCSVIEQSTWDGQVLEVAGGQAMTTREFVEKLMQVAGQKKGFVTIPGPVAWLAAVLLEQIQNVPLLSRDQLRIARIDGDCEPNGLVTELGINPTPIEVALKVYGSET